MLGKKEFKSCLDNMHLTDITTAQELADALATNYKRFLVYYLYRVPIEQRYLAFQIPKKNGGTREILSPSTHLKTIQRRLKAILEEAYTPKIAVHGFTAERSIRTNADKHINKRYILNIDLSDFFGSINFGRVRGMFMAHPYNLNHKVATLLAQICCHNGSIPQGAPTSPIISNMICSRMDSALRHLAKAYNCTYTRYADDITFSTTMKVFPKEIAQDIGESGKRIILLGKQLQSIITGNGFIVNPTKTRLQTKQNRQEVTGIVTNKKRNVNRRYIRKTRAMLHSVEYLGSDAAAALHYEKHPYHYIAPFKSRPPIEWIIRGRIEFIRFICGEYSSPYRSLARKFNELYSTSSEFMVPPDQDMAMFDNYTQNVFLLQEDSILEEGIYYATAFYLEDVRGIITAAHYFDNFNITAEDNRSFWIFNPQKLGHSYEVKLRCLCRKNDIAILDLQESEKFTRHHPAHKPFRLKNQSIRLMQETILIGWPNFRLGNSINISHGVVESLNTQNRIDRMHISNRIISGTSGGPILNKNNMVVGIALKGNNHLNPSEVTFNEAINSKHIKDVVRNEENYRYGTPYS